MYRSITLVALSFFAGYIVGPAHSVAEPDNSKIFRIVHQSSVLEPDVYDGDSFWLGDYRIRLRGLDAPESKQECFANGGKVECGQDSRNKLVALLANGPIKCILKYGTKGKPEITYGRYAADCKAGNVDINREMLVGGFAVPYVGYSKEYHVRWAEKARKRKVGIHAYKFDNPKDYRRKQRSPKKFGLGNQVPNVELAEVCAEFDAEYRNKE